MGVLCPVLTIIVRLKDRVSRSVKQAYMKHIKINYQYHFAFGGAKLRIGMSRRPWVIWVHCANSREPNILRKGCNSGLVNQEIMRMVNYACAGERVRKSISRR